MQSIDETCMKSESIDPLDLTGLPEQREETVASECSANCENNSIDRAVMLKKDDFEKICRCCLSDRIVGNILYLKFGETFFVDIICKLLGTQVNPNDGLPKNICAACVTALINFYYFHKKYNDSLATLLSALRDDQVYNIQDDILHEDINEEKPDISISENELDEESLNEDIKNQEPESTISDDPKNEQFHMENSDINISEDELDQFQYESNEKETINGVDNNVSTSKKHKQTVRLPRLCKICKTLITGKEHNCSINTKRSYVCNVCGKGFLKNETLQVHYRVHKLLLLADQTSDQEEAASPVTDTSKQKRMNACSCGEIFYSSKDLSQHKTEKNHLDPLLDERCKICNKVVTSRGLYKHMRNAHSAEQLLNCNTCGKIFKSRQNLQQHVQIHGEKKFLCADCGKRFHKAARFKSHCLIHTGEKPFTCNVCGEKFRTSANLKTHTYIHTGKKPHVCKFCSKAFRQMPHLRRHLRSHTGEKPYNCPYCDKTFAHATSRTVHIRTHTGEKPYTCDTCGESFSQLTSKKLHQRSHTGEKPYLCDHCGESFSIRSSYRNHLTVKHQEKINSVQDEDFQCNICNKFYSSKQALKAHMYRHGEKRHLCTYCGKGFYTKGALDVHCVIHTGEKRFSCGLCGKKFSRLLNYKYHQYIHRGQKPYNCKICSKDFIQKQHLITHMRVHTGEKPFGCPHCDKTFAHYSTRTVHIRSHTGETPYVCDVCSKGFYHSSSMTKHRQRHFKNKVSSESADCEASD